MKQLSRTSVYWQGIVKDIHDFCKSCDSCCGHQNNPSKAPVHPWMFPEKPWSRIHIDHAINCMGSNWLIIIDPCIHPMQSTSTKSTIELLEQNFAHFGHPHIIVSDNATSFTSDEFQSFCRQRGIIHFIGTPYHPATNGAAERMVQSFKNSLKKLRCHPNLHSRNS